MKKGTKIGLVLVAISIVLSVWVIVSESLDANHQVGDFILSDDDTIAVEYVGAGGAVTIPDGVTTINGGLFKNCNVITSVTMPSTVTSLGTEVFSGATQLQNVTLSQNITSIPTNTFRECASLISVSLPSSVGSIGTNAFYGCATLSSISIPSGCTSVSTDAFKECTNLSSISVNSGNPNYSSSDGCLYNVTGTRLILVPEGKTSCSISGACTTIGGGAFSGCTSLNSLAVPTNVTVIEENAFSGSGIKTITIPASVGTIGAQASWSPSTIYGSANSAAETFAKNNNIPFVITDPTPDPKPDPTPDPKPDPTPDPNPPIPNPDNPAESGGVINADGTVTYPDGTITDAAGNILVKGTSFAHAKDQTPTTADGDIDIRYVLCIAILLIGLGFILYSRFRKVAIIKKKK